MPTAILDDALYCGFNIVDNKKALLVAPKFSESAEANLYHAKDMNDLKNYLDEYAYLLNKDVDCHLDMDTLINLIVDGVL